jgi:hypothetical protein
MLFLALLFTSLCTACDKDESEKETPGGIDEVSFPNRYYIDTENGAYYNTGHSPSQAWESVDRIMERTWGPGDTILIKRGTVYNGTLTLKGSGSEEAPVVIDAYGPEELSLPEINGEGKKDETILIRNVEYWELHNLKITNKGELPRPKSVGIRIIAENIPGGTMNHIHIKGCTVADVYGTKTHHLGGGGGGIHYYNVVESATPSSFNDLVVENCHLIDCQRDGLTGYLSTGNRSQRKANTNVVFRGNLFEGIPGDVIIVNGCDGAIVEENVVRDCAAGDFSPEGIDFRAEAAAAVWCIHSDGTVFRYNIVQDHKATWDGQAFDCDQNCQNTLYEYNITYNNAGGFFLVCPADANHNNGFADFKGLVVRYNISINDGTRDYLKEDGARLSSTIDVVGRVVESHFYNNTIIKTRSAAQHADNSAITYNTFSNIPRSMIFMNNIFYNTTGVANEFCRPMYGEFVENRGVVFQNNCIVGYSTPVPGSGEYNENNLQADPKFVRLVTDFLDNNNLVDLQEVKAGLQLATGSPCLGTGKSVVDDGFFPVGNDFWGVAVGSTRNIGAFNH